MQTPPPTQWRPVNKLPGCVSQGEAPELGDAAVHHEPPEEQGGVARGTAGGVARRHPWGVGRRARLRHGLQLGQRGPADRALLFRALRECLTHGPLRPSFRPKARRPSPLRPLTPPLVLRWARPRLERSCCFVLLALTWAEGERAPSLHLRNCVYQKRTALNMSTSSLA